MASEPLIEQLWQRKAEEERGEVSETKAVDLFFMLKEKAEALPELRSLTDELERRIDDYADAVIRTVHEKEGRAAREDIQSSDQHRRIMHDALIATLNQLARLYRKLHLDRGWRTAIGPEREEVGRWAIIIAQDMLGKKVH